MGPDEGALSQSQKRVRNEAEAKQEMGRRRIQREDNWMRPRL